MADNSDKIYVADEGIELLVDTGIVLAGASKVSLSVIQPDLIVRNWVGTISDSTKISYKLSAGDLPVDGIYKIQSDIELGALAVRGDTFSIEVLRKWR